MVENSSIASFRKSTLMRIWQRVFSDRSSRHSTIAMEKTSFIVTWSPKTSSLSAPMLIQNLRLSTSVFPKCSKVAVYSVWTQELELPITSHLRFSPVATIAHVTCGQQAACFTFSYADTLPSSEMTTTKSCKAWLRVSSILMERSGTMLTNKPKTWSGSSSVSLISDSQQVRPFSTHGC